MTHQVLLELVLCVQYPIHDTADLVGVSAVGAESHTYTVGLVDVSVVCAVSHT